MHETLELLRGSVKAVIYQNIENGYAVLKLKCEDGSECTVVGTIPATSVGERLLVTGRWGSHPSYGKQFEAEFLERLLPDTRAEILAYLSSRAVRGIGAKTAEKLVAEFGDRTLDVLENHPEELTRLPGITPKKAKQMNDSFCKQVGVRRLIEYLTLHHLPAELAVRVYRVYGELSREALADDPYLLTDGFFGADFAAVDAFALSCGTLADDERRVEAAILFELTHNLGNGHSFLPLDKLLEATAALLGLEMDLVSAGAVRLARRKRLELDEIARLKAAYLPEYHEAECYLSQRLLRMARSRVDAPDEPEKLIARIEKALDIQYAAKQREVILLAARSGVLLLTGGPGTGKTTTLAGILALFDELQLKTLLAAPTGRAAKRLSELTGRDASTIHRLLEVDVDPQTGQMCFLHDEDEPLSCDVLIVDETSMVDLQLMYALVRALPKRCRLILVGDPDQLPSVGAGNLFADLIRSERINTVVLTEIFRQARESLIVMNAHAVNHGELPVLTAKDRDFFFLRRPGAPAVAQTIVELCAKRLPERMGIAPGEIQVLSPTRKGETGTQRLNALLQNALNPPAPDKYEKAYGDFTYREGDRVMQIRNNYDMIWQKADGTEGAGIFNGDVGIVQRIDKQQELMTIAFDERVTEYPFEQLSELEPAYAMTVHKSQGSEYRAVVLAVQGGSPYLMTRSILYTAITRARELLILVGREEVVQAMVENDRRQRRYSGLKWRLRRAEV